MSNTIVRKLINVSGIVQGVGFRPFVFKIASMNNIKGWIKNNAQGVVIDAEGIEIDMLNFVKNIKEDAPSLSFIQSYNEKYLEYFGYTSFDIKESDASLTHNILISPDVSICSECIEEINDSKNRRFKYPFTNCTNCGPRFTITENIPYDREKTVMKKFKMCKACEQEYSNPLDRRFHAQPISCNKCGPSIYLLDAKGEEIKAIDPIEITKTLLKEGCILAIKGIGGYHLVVDAKNEEAVKKLRERKNRDGKSFALMARDIEVVKKYCNVSIIEEETLKSIKSPIVLLEKLNNNKLHKNISIDNDKLGIILPYTPLHILLFDESLELLVMTSGNMSLEPIFYKDEEAIFGLKNIADYFLMHDRDIHIRTDDSVTSIFEDKEYIIRRARGYVPFPLTLPLPKNIKALKIDIEKLPNILACGGELKNTFCLSKKNSVFISHHIGDLENFETLKSFEDGIVHFKKILMVEPSVIAFDLHPEYLSTKYAKECEIPNKIAIQHHHAHIASVMAENNLSKKVIGIAFDGSGYGEDGNIWGGEIFTGDYLNFKREAHLKYVPMPGGEIAIKEPWRMALSYLKCAFGNDFSIIDIEFLKNFDRIKGDIIIQQIDKKINSPLTSSVGRLFDAVSALLGICNKIEYEGQAAILLENYANLDTEECYRLDIIKKTEDAPLEIDVLNLFKYIVEDIMIGKTIRLISTKFHNTLAKIIVLISKKIRKEKKLNTVVLSGGVFQNMTLLKKSLTALKDEGFETYIHSMVPTNDGGISYGQATIALWKTIHNS